MENIKKLFQFIKDLWGNRRYRALAILICYFIFFAIIIIPLKANINKNNLDNEIDNEIQFIETLALSNYSKIETYESLITINNQLILKELNNENGLIYKVISDSNNNYSADQILYDGVSNNYFFDLSKLSIKNIYTYISNAKFDYESNYTGKKSYVIPINEFSLLFTGEQIDDESYVIINTYEADDNINKVELDFNNYIKYFNNNLSNYKVIIDYENKI